MAILDFIVNPILRKQVKDLTNQNANLQRRIQVQRTILRQMDSLNRRRKATIKVLCQQRDEVINYILYTDGVLDAYGHKGKETLEFPLREDFLNRRTNLTSDYFDHIEYSKTGSFDKAIL